MLPRVHFNVVHYPYSPSALIFCQCCSKSNTLCCTNRILRSRLPPRLLPRNKHPALNGELLTPSRYKKYKMINAGYVESTLTLAQPGSALFLYVAKMAALEYEKCTLIHTSRFDLFEYTIRVLSVHLFSPDLNWNALRTQTKAS